jgi:anti-sigma regulatory factor (Ser/Thr protein kinase)
MLVGVRHSIRKSFPATPETVGIIRRDVARFAAAAGFSGRRLDDVRIAVSEAATNVVQHAYRGLPGDLHFSVSAVEDELWILISDDGLGPDAPSVTPGLGWGLAIITDAADEFTLLARADGGTEARMCFRLDVRSV